MKSIVIGCDHAGLELKEIIIDHLHKKDRIILDVGTGELASVDYPDYAHEVAVRIDENTLGILLCGSGNGVCMTANKHIGIRAALCWEEKIAALARAHNDANVVCIPARFVSQKNAIEIVEAFLATDFEGGRHKKRVEKIEAL